MKGRWKILFLLVFLIPLVATVKVHAIENSECLECHGDVVDEERFKASVHGMNEIACTDCHAGVEKLNYEEDVPHPTPLKVDCSQCHEDEADSFQEGVHADLGDDGPKCQTCHNPHYTKYTASKLSFERNRETCLKCHDPEEGHEFLPAKKLHFETVGCSACHSKAGGMVRLIPYNILKEKPVSGEELAKALGVDPDALLERYDANHSGKLETGEIEKLIKDAEAKGIRFSLKGEIVSQADPSLHQIESEGISQCLKCHSEKAKIFDHVVLSLSKSDGSTADIPVDKKFLMSIYPIRFYMIDATRITILDIIGALIVLGGVAFAGGHCTIRILTIPLRRKKKEEQ